MLANESFQTNEKFCNRSLERIFIFGCLNIYKLYVSNVLHLWIFLLCFRRMKTKNQEMEMTELDCSTLDVFSFNQQSSTFLHAIPTLPKTTCVHYAYGHLPCLLSFSRNVSSRSNSFRKHSKGKHKTKS